MNQNRESVVNNIVHSENVQKLFNNLNDVIKYDLNSNEYFLNIHYMFYVILQ